MGRKKIFASEEILALIDEYFYEVSAGDPSMLKFSLLEKYASEKGIYVKACNMRRDPILRNRLEELKKQLFEDSEYFPVPAYKTLDTDGLLSHCRNVSELKNILSESDRYWKGVYDAAEAVKRKNTELLREKDELAASQRETEAEVDRLIDELRAVKKKVSYLVKENRELRRYMKRYLYPALANELLKEAHLPSEENTSVLPEAFTDLIEPVVPLPFDGVQKQKGKVQTRQEKLLAEMMNQVQGDDDV